MPFKVIQGHYMCEFLCVNNSRPIYLLSCTVSEISGIIGQVVAIDIRQGVPVFNVQGEPLNSWPQNLVPRKKHCSIIRY